MLILDLEKEVPKKKETFYFHSSEKYSWVMHKFYVID